MNFLAHAYLSFNNPEILVGNMISDFVKGSRQFQYPEAIQNGITLHRKIDTFTDSHIGTKKAKDFFRSEYRLYSAPITDVIFDHFLATDTAIFNDESLLHFTKNVYLILEDNTVHLPWVFNNVLHYMKTENWLFNYSKKEGIEKSLRGLIRRSRFITDHTMAYTLFNENYHQLQQCYSELFKDVKEYAKQEMEQLVS